MYLFEKFPWSCEINYTKVACFVPGVIFKYFILKMSCNSRLRWEKIYKDNCHFSSSKNSLNIFRASYEHDCDSLGHLKTLPIVQYMVIMDSCKRKLEVSLPVRAS